MTDTDTQKLAELLAKATPVPWYVSKGLMSSGPLWITTTMRESNVCGRRDGPIGSVSTHRTDISEADGFGGRTIRDIPHKRAKDDADLIVAAVNALPTLLAHIAALEARLSDADALREAAQHMTDAWQDGDQDALECAEANIRAALAGNPLTYETIADARVKEAVERERRLEAALRVSRGWVITCSGSAQARRDLKTIDAALDIRNEGPKP